MTTHTRIIPPNIRSQLETARYRLRLAKQADNEAWTITVLTEIDELLDQTGGDPCR